MTYRERRRRLAIGFGSIALLSALPALAADDIRSEIEAANRMFEAAVSRSDGTGVAALYTDSGQLLPAQSDFVTGTEAISQFWQAAFDSGLKGVSLATLEVETMVTQRTRSESSNSRARTGRCWTMRSTSSSGRRKVLPGNSIATSGPPASFRSRSRECWRENPYPFSIEFSPYVDSHHPDDARRAEI